MVFLLHIYIYIYIYIYIIYSLYLYYSIEYDTIYHNSILYSGNLYRLHKVAYMDNLQVGPKFIHVVQIFQ